MQRVNQGVVISPLLPDKNTVSPLEIPGIDNDFSQFYSTISGEYKPISLFNNLFKRTDAVVDQARTCDNKSAQGGELTFIPEFLGELVNEMGRLPGDHAGVRSFMHKVKQYFHPKLAHLANEMTDTAIIFTNEGANLGITGVKTAQAFTKIRDHLDSLTHEIGFPKKSGASIAHWQEEIKKQLSSIHLTLSPADEKIFADQIQLIFAQKQEQISAIQAAEAKTREKKQAIDNSADPFKKAAAQSEAQRYKQDWCLKLQDYKNQSQHLMQGLKGAEKLVMLAMKGAKCKPKEVEEIQYLCKSGKQLLGFSDKVMTLAQQAIQGGLSSALLGPFAAVATALYKLYEWFIEPRVDPLSQNLQQILHNTAVLSQQIAKSHEAMQAGFSNLSAQLRQLYRGMVTGFDFIERAQQRRHEEMLSILLDMKLELKQQGERIRDNITSFRSETKSFFQAMYEQAYEQDRGDAQYCIADSKLLKPATYHHMIGSFLTHIVVGAKKPLLAGEFRPIARQEEIDIVYLKKLADDVNTHGIEKMINPLISMTASFAGIRAQAAFVNPAVWSTRILDFIYFVKFAPRYSFTQKQLQIFTEIIAEGLNLEQFICTLKCNQPIFEFLFAGYFTALSAIKRSMRSIILQYLYPEAQHPEVKNDDDRMRMLRTAVLEELYPWSRALLKIKQTITRSEQFIAELKRDQTDAETKLINTRATFVETNGYHHVQLVTAVPEFKAREASTLYIFDQTETIDICSIAIEPPRRLTPEQRQQLRQTLRLQAEERTRGGVLVQFTSNSNSPFSPRYVLRRRPESARIREIIQACGLFVLETSYFFRTHTLIEQKDALLKKISNDNNFAWIPVLGALAPLLSTVGDGVTGLYDSAMQHTNVGMLRKDMKWYQTVLDTHIRPKLAWASEQLTGYQEEQARVAVFAAQEDQSLKDDVAIRDYLIRYRKTIPSTAPTKIQNITQRICTAIETEGSVLQEAIAQVNTFFILINVYAALAFRREYDTDQILRYWLKTVLYDKERWLKQLGPLADEKIGDEEMASSFIYYRLINQIIPQTEQAKVFIANLVNRAQQAAKDKTLNAAYPIIDDTFSQLEKLRLLLFPTAKFGLSDRLDPRNSLPSAEDEVKDIPIIPPSSVPKGAGDSQTTGTAPGYYDLEARLFRICRAGEHLSTCTGVYSGRLIQFGEYKVAGDGNCGFTVLSVSRKEAVKILLASATEEKVRIAPGKELIESTRAYKPGEIDPTQGMTLEFQKEIKEKCQQMDDLDKQLISQLFILRNIMRQTKILLRGKAIDSKFTDEDLLQALQNGELTLPKTLAGEINKILSARNQLQAIEQKLCRPEIVTAYINNYDQDNERGLWLGVTSMYYIARAKGMGLQVWGEDKEQKGTKKRLRLVDEYLLLPKRPEQGIVCALLHGAHFNFLVQEESGDLLSDHSKESKSLKRKSAPAYTGQLGSPISGGAGTRGYQPGLFGSQTHSHQSRRPTSASRTKSMRQGY